MTRKTRRRTRRGAVAVEVAVLLWALLLLAFAVADFWLVFHRAGIVLDCAFNGAAAGIPVDPPASPDAAIRTAVQETASPPNAAWADRLPYPPTVTWTEGKDANDLRYIEVTVTHTPDGSVFAILSSGTTPVSWTIRMMAPPPSID